MTLLKLSGNDIGQVVHTHLFLSPAVLFGTCYRAVMSYGLEGNRRSGITLAMHYRLNWFIHLSAQELTLTAHQHSLLGMVLLTFIIDLVAGAIIRCPYVRPFVCGHSPI